MISSPPCPVCATKAWKAIGTRTYLRSHVETLDTYTALRYRVLFEVWCHDKNEITLESQLCMFCGFVIYTPRPTADDLDAKYRFLTRLGANQSLLSSTTPVEAARSKKLYGWLAKRVGKKKSRILDFGGSDGRLMSSFINHGHDCYLVDYNPTPIPGITKLADTLENVPEDLSFDIIVCSHVLEHLADPFDVTAALRSRLTNQGFLYVEVPMEIWRVPPLPVEPVTHVNYFTTASLKHLLERAGYKVIYCRMGVPFHGAMTVVRAVAVSSAEDIVQRVPAEESVRATKRLLSPDIGNVCEDDRCKSSQVLEVGKKTALATDRT